jgi:hypothetical protein
MAIHALCLKRPGGWKRAVTKGAEWLWSQQAEFGGWSEECAHSVYLTVLVLDAIELAAGGTQVTFRTTETRGNVEEDVSKAQPKESVTQSAAQRWLAWVDRALILSERVRWLHGRCKRWRIVEGKTCPGDVVGVDCAGLDRKKRRPIPDGFLTPELLEKWPFFKTMKVQFIGGEETHYIYTHDEDYWPTIEGFQAHLLGFDQVATEMSSFCPPLYKQCEKAIVRLQTLLHVASEGKHNQELPYRTHFLLCLEELRDAIRGIVSVAGPQAEEAPSRVTNRVVGPEPETPHSGLPSKGGARERTATVDRHEHHGQDRGWECLKEWAEEERRHGGGPPFRVLREADGKEVASILDALVVQARDAWSTCQPLCAVPPDEVFSDELANTLGKCTSSTDAFLAIWWRAFECLLEAERWFYKEYGPGADAKIMDRIADAMMDLDDISSTVFQACGSTTNLIIGKPIGQAHTTRMRAELQAQSAGFQKCLGDLHRIARTVAETAVEGKPAGGDVEKDQSPPHRPVTGQEGGKPMAMIFPPNYKPSPGEDWSIPMSMAEIARRLELDPRTAKEQLTKTGLWNLSRQNWRVRLDTLPPNMKKKVTTHPKRNTE